MGDGLRWIGGRWIEVRDAVDWAVASRGGGVGHRTEESAAGGGGVGRRTEESAARGGGGVGHRTEESAARRGGGVGHRTEESAAAGRWIEVRDAVDWRAVD